MTLDRCAFVVKSVKFGDWYRKGNFEASQKNRHVMGIVTFCLYPAGTIYLRLEKHTTWASIYSWVYIHIVSSIHGIADDRIWSTADHVVVSPSMIDPHQHELQMSFIAEGIFFSVNQRILTLLSIIKWKMKNQDPTSEHASTFGEDCPHIKGFTYF